MKSGIKALSIRQPHIGRILRGEKKEEYRTWQTQYRGPLVLHSSKKLDRDELEPGEEVGPTGAFLGVVALVDVRMLENGAFAWVLSNPRTFNCALPGKGKLNLFDPTLTC